MRARGFGKFETMNDLEAAVERHALRCKDATVEIGALDYQGDGHITWDNATLFDAEHTDAYMEKLAYQQLVRRLNGPPSRWLRDGSRCPLDLEKTIVRRLINHQHHQDPTSLFMRMRESGDQTHVRAVLSEQYTPFDNKDLVGMLGDALTVLPDNAGVQVKRGRVGDWMRAYILLGGIEINVPDNGDNGGLHPAIYISNSEVGTGSVHITAGVYRSVCQNGVIYGWGEKRFETLQHRWYSRASFKSVVADNVANAFDMSVEAAQKFVESQRIPVNKSRLANLVEQWSAKGITVESRDRWKTMAQAEAQNAGREDMTLWDTINGLTRAAQMTENDDETELMERTAGDILAKVQI